MSISSVHRKATHGDHDRPDRDATVGHVKQRKRPNFDEINDVAAQHARRSKDAIAEVAERAAEHHHHAHHRGRIACGTKRSS